MLKNFLFDLDDTLVDTRSACFRACRQVAIELGLKPPDWQRFAAVYGRASFSDCFHFWHGHSASFSAYEALYRERVSYDPIGPVSPLLEGLVRRGLTTGVVTRSESTETHRKLTASGVARELLCFVVPRTDRPGNGPSGKPFAEILYTYRLDPTATVYISDNPVDAVDTRRLGMHFRGVETGIHTRQDFRHAAVPAWHVHRDVQAAVRYLLEDLSETLTPDPRAQGYPPT